MEPLPETLRRLKSILEELELNSSDVLDPEDLAARTALAPDVVRTLLQGGDVPEDDVDDRVRARIKALCDARMRGHGATAEEREASRRKAKPDLIGDLVQKVEISRPWAQKLVEGEKPPNLKLLHRLVAYFKVDPTTGEAFFTAAAPVALNRELAKVLAKYEAQLEAKKADPVQALLRQYGVASVDARQHGDDSITPQQLAAILTGLAARLKPEAEGEQG